MSEADNHMRWRGERGRYEVWYLTCNDLPTRTGFWIRYTLHAPAREGAEPHARLWFAAFDAGQPGRSFAINRRFPIADLSERRDPWTLAIGPARLAAQGGEYRAEGAVAGAGHKAEWSLRFAAAPRTLRHLPDPLYRSSLPDTLVHSPNPAVRLSGRIAAGGRAIELRDQPGCQTHLWGRKHAHAWAWAHCNAFREDPDALVEAVSARLRRGPIVLPPLTVLHVRAGGAEHRFAGLRQIARASGRWETGRYRFGARDRDLRVRAEWTCRPEDLVQARYADPNGAPAWCANTEVAHARVEIERRSRGRWRREHLLTSPGAGHFETGARRPDPFVAREHVEVDG